MDVCDPRWGDCRDFPGKPAYGIAKLLSEYSYEKYNFESDDVDIYITVLVQAGKDRDEEWINGEICQAYCDAIKLPHVMWLRICQAMWKLSERGADVN